MTRPSADVSPDQSRLGSRRPRARGGNQVPTFERGLRRSDELLRGFAALVGCAFVFGGCFLERSALAPAPDQDASIEPRDAGAPDAATPCTDADARCDGERAISCTAGRLSTIDCASLGAFCAVGGDGVACSPRVCTPSVTECADDGASVVTCDARGSDVTSTTPCPRGCQAGSCRPQTPCDRPIAATLSEGSVSVDLCGGGNDADYADSASDDCTDFFEADGEDRVVRLEVSQPGRYRIELADDDGSAFLDPVVYVRSDCAGAGSQLGCDDNGDDAFGSLDARLELDLPAGDVFLILDTHDTVPFTAACGRVRLTLTRL